MNNHSKQAVRVAAIFEILLLTEAMMSIASRQWKDLALSLLAMVCLMLPFVIARVAKVKNIALPSVFQLLTVLFIFMAQYLGEIKKFYQLFWWWDLLLHAIFGSFVVVVTLYSIKGMIKKDQEMTDQRFTLFTVIFAFNVSITLGTLWEMFEFIGDYLFKAGMVKGGIEDTATDILAKILAAFITALICYYRSLEKSLKIEG